MNKQAIEAYQSFKIRRALRQAQIVAAKILSRPSVVPAPRPSPSELDRLMWRRKDEEDQRRQRLLAVMMKKKRLPLPVFSCENTIDCGESEHAEGHCEQLRPRIVKEETS